MGWRRVARTAVSVGALALPGCGGRGEASKPSGPDLSTPRSTWDGALRALEAGDLAALAPYLTPAADRRLRSDLEAWRRALVDPGDGPRVLSRLSGRAELDPDVLRRALAGDAAALLRVLVAADPRPFAPLDASPAAARSAEVLYAVGDGSLRSVLLAREEDGWRVARLDP